jgi:hypothetical protein
LDADADTSITADTDDQIDIKIGGADDFQFTANTFTAQSGSTIAAQALTATTITASGIVKTDDTTDATTTTDGSLQTDGGLSVVKDAVFGDDVKLLSDSAVLSFGADSEITLTHVHNSGLKLNDDKILYLGDDQDFQFYHNNSSNLQVIDANARLLIRSPRIDFQDGDGTETTGVVIEDGVFQLYHDDVKKLETASTGVTISGTSLTDRGDASAPGYSFSDDTDTGMFNVSNADLAFSVGGTERMRIDSSGNISVGGGIISSSRLSVSSSGTDGRIMALHSSGTGATDAILIQNDNGEVGTVRTSGSSTSYNTSSDYRLKENVNYSWDATTRLKQLKPARFNFKADADLTLDGFLAHEVSSIVPEAISGTKDETQDLGIVKNKDGDVIYEDVLEIHTKKDEGQTWTKTKTEDVYQGIDQSKLVPLLVKTIQELEARVTGLEEA